MEWDEDQVLVCSLHIYVECIHHVLSQLLDPKFFLTVQLHFAVITF